MHNAMAIKETNRRTISVDQFQISDKNNDCAVFYTTDRANRDDDKG